MIVILQFKASTSLISESSRWPLPRKLHDKCYPTLPSLGDTHENGAKQENGTSATVQFEFSNPPRNVVIELIYSHCEMARARFDSARWHLHRWRSLIIFWPKLLNTYMICPVEAKLLLHTQWSKCRNWKSFDLYHFYRVSFWKYLPSLSLIDHFWTYLIQFNFNKNCFWVQNRTVELSKRYSEKNTGCQAVWTGYKKVSSHSSVN